jgi:hypothetical protein
VQSLAATNKMRILTILMFLWLVSCQERPLPTVKVVKYSNERLLVSLLLKEIEVIDDAKISVEYIDDSAYTQYQFVIYKNNKSEIEFMSTPAVLIDSSYFEVSGEKIKVLKYRYDVKGSVDEELDIYITTKGEILGMKELAWNGYDFFYKEKHLDIINHLKNDSTVFFRYNHRFEYL